MQADGAHGRHAQPARGAGACAPASASQRRAEAHNLHMRLTTSHEAHNLHQLT